jgi:hypothetical protein
MQANLLIASSFAGAVAEATVRGHTRLYRLGDPPPHTHAPAPLPLAACAAVLGGEVARLLLALAWQSVLEYWWHIGARVRVACPPPLCRCLSTSAFAPRSGADVACAGPGWTMRRGPRRCPDLSRP